MPGKILERLLNGRLQRYAEENQLYKPNQYGFRANRGTQQAIAVAYETIGQELAKGMTVRVVLRDVKSAFDKVWHTGLKVKLLRGGLPPRFLSAITTFLDDRTATVRVQGHTTEPFPLRAGVPQGAILSPALYNLYVADMPQSVRGRNIVFADDVSQIVSGYRNRIQQYVEEEIHRTSRYERKWKIRTCPNKFKIVATNRPKLRLSYRVDPTDPTKIAEEETQGRFLGLQLRATGLHHSAVERAKIAHAKLGALQRFKNLSSQKKRTLYMAQIRSYMLYPCVPWEAVGSRQQASLQTVQNHAANFIGGYDWRERTTARRKGEDQKLEPISATLKRHAEKVWHRLQQLDDDLFQKLRDDSNRLRRRFKRLWPSSLHSLEKDRPDYYTQKEALEQRRAGTNH